MIPAPAQGALAVEYRADDTELTELLATIDHGATHAAVTAEEEPALIHEMYSVTPNRRWHAAE